MLADRGTRLKRSWLDCHEIKFLHDLTHSGATARVAHIPKVPGDSSGTVTSSVLPEDVAGDRLQLRVGQLAYARKASPPGVLSCPTNPLRFVDVCDFKTTSIRLVDHRVNIGYSCWLKMAKFFGMSRPRRVRCSSSRNSVTWSSRTLAADPLRARTSAFQQYSKFVLLISWKPKLPSAHQASFVQLRPFSQQRKFDVNDAGLLVRSSWPSWLS